MTWLPQKGRGLSRAILKSGGEISFASTQLSESELAAARVTALQLQKIEALPREMFIERIVAPQRLFVLGAGDDAKPLVGMAGLLGWSVTVMDGRGQLAHAERFPEAERVEAISSASVAGAAIRSGDAVVLMTHSYEQDRELLAAVLPKRPRYFGLLGARHRSSLLVSEAAAMLGWPVDACCELIYAPVGLDLGGRWCGGDCAGGDR